MKERLGRPSGTSFVAWWGELFGIRSRETICGGDSGVESRGLRTADLWAVKETAPRPPLIDSFNGILTPFVVLHLLNEFGNITCRAGPPRGRLWEAVIDTGQLAGGGQAGGWWMAVVQLTTRHGEVVKVGLNLTDWGWSLLFSDYKTLRITTK